MVIRRPLRLGKPRLRACCIAALVATIAGPSLFAIDEADVDFDVVKELNRLEFYDFAEMLLEQMEAKYPQRIEEVLVDKARTFYACGKSKQADAALARIKPGSSDYLNALLLKAEVAALRGQNESAAKAYADFFRRVKAPAADNQRAVEQYTRAVTVYNAVLKRQGKGEEAAKVLELLGTVAGASDRKLSFLKAQALLDTEEGKANDGKAVSDAVVRKALDQLQALLYLRDGVAASSYLETTRAHILLAGAELNALRVAKKDKDALQVGGFKDALKTIRMADQADLFRDIEKQVTKGKDSSDSPYAGAFYYKGEAYRGLALAHYMAGDQAKARKLAEAAGKLFETVVVDYGESDYRMKALAKHGKCSAFLEQIFGVKLELTDANIDAEMDLKLEQAQAFLQTSNYQGAIPIYVEAIRLGRRSKRLPDVAMRLIICYGNLGRFLEAQAIGSYLVDVLPNSEGTAECLFRLGASMYEGAKGLGGAAKEELLSQAMDAWELFVENAQEHSKAPEVSFAIAEHYYRLAAAIAARSEQAAGTENKEKLKAEAKEAYLRAIPRYQRLVDRYSAMDKGVRALYKLGWIYYSTGQPEQSVDAFLRYSESETLGTYADDRLEAKFRAAEQMMLGENPGEGAEQFHELLSWLTPDNDKGFNVKTKTATRIREDATSYAAWSYDLAGENGRPELAALQERIADLGRGRREAADTIQVAEARLQALNTEREDIQRQYRDVDDVLGNVELDFMKAAMTEAEKRGESSEGKSEEEKAFIRQNVEGEARKLAADMAARTEVRVSGERTAREAERDVIKAEITEIADTRQRYQADLGAATKARDAALATAEKTEQDLRMRKDAIAAVDKAIVQGEDQARDLEEKIQELQDKITATNVADERKTLRDEGRAVAEQLAACRSATAKAYKQRETVADKDAQAAIAKSESELPGLRLALTAAEATLAELTQRGELLAVEDAILQARLRAVAKALDANRMMAKALTAETPVQQQALVPELEKESTAALTEFGAVRDLRLKRVALLEAAAKARISAAGSRTEDIARQVAATNEEMTPVKARFVDWKTQAQTAFVSFLDAYPKSNHVPNNLSRLGTIYLELEQYDKAADTLARLAKEFPDSKATQEALFSLGRAQWEGGDLARATESFTKLLENAASVNPANLNYISERMLENGSPAVSLAASRELIRRSEDAEDPDYQRIHDKARAPNLFRAGQAALRLKQYKEALDAFTVLLEENPRTGYFFDVKFGMASARSNMTPPDRNGAISDLGDIMRFSEDPVQANHALCLVGEALAAEGDARSTQQALARYQQVVLLANPAIERNLPWIEMAIVESAKAFAQLGQEKGQEEMKKLYRERFPDGKRAAELGKLPALGASASQPDSAVQGDAP